MVDWIAEALCRLIVCVILLPVCLILATPVILLLAPFRSGRIRADYRRVIEFWFELPWVV